MEPSKLRTAAYRLATDMIKMDNLISSREIEIVGSLVSQLGITNQDMRLSSFMKLSEAVATVASGPARTADRIYNALLDCARSDEVCSRDEAVLLHALKSCMGGKSRIISVPNTAIPIQNDKIIYVSPEAGTAHPTLDDPAVRTYMERTARLGGFELVYIPAACRDYVRKGGKDALARFLSILSPALSQEQIQMNISRLSAMSSGWFLSNVLIRKFRFPSVITSPVWMTRLPDNMVDGGIYANFLITDVEDDMPAQMDRIIESVSMLQNSFSVNINYRHKNADGNFEYSGFMKSILEMMALSSERRWDIIIRTTGCKEFTGADGQQYRTSVTIRKDDTEWPLVQGDRDAAFYVLVLMSTALEGGLHLRRGDMETDSQMQKRYELVYNSMRAGMDPPLVAFYKTRNPIRSRIAKTIREDMHLDEHDLYQIAESGSSLFVPLDASHIRVISRESGRVRETSLLESGLYAGFCRVK